ncbi:Peptide/nickel transport system permease protein OS=Bosea thiooxidans OX=53254 GN=SAMN05660750_04962 PE=3 SV=1 [Bosea thiooxidans]|uniref:Peptide/nickel transport system permease protein n=2 Tax=Bosea thiooxidans TaxID=53254 RepID=A0A1T5H774_9HYPH|nr:ABC transporter permease [Bosea thiooxidans]SKC16401.1 peptide/nickel transport system permease protein [Bosea thiooxidans]
MAVVTETMSSAASSATRAPRSPGALILRRILGSWQGQFGTVVLAIIVGLGLAAPWLSPYSPTDIDPDAFSMPPSAAHWFGTDEIGRDVLSRVLHGATVSLQVVIFAIGLALIAGSILGLVSGWLGGLWDALIMRIMDAFLAFPLLVLALSIVAVLGPDLINAMLAIAITKMPGFARLVRAEVLSLREADYVVAAQAAGARPLRILLRHIWPNVSGNVIVYGSLSASQALITESALSFLGLGVQPPTPSWGYMVATGIQFYQSWWMSFFPGLAIFLTVLALNFLGDAVRDAFDARLGGSHD